MKKIRGMFVTEEELWISGSFKLIPSNSSYEYGGRSEPEVVYGMPASVTPFSDRGISDRVLYSYARSDSECR